MKTTATREGLYDPAYEHDACGVGFICNIQNEPSHEMVTKGIEMLVNMEHRGVCGCDERTGDGTGIMLQLAHEFLGGIIEDVGGGRGGAGEYAWWLVILRAVAR